MTALTIDHGRVDRVLPGWVLVWCTAFTIVVASIVGSFDGRGLSADANVFFGASLGGLFATWLMMATWIVLIDLPNSAYADTFDEGTHQRMRPRAAMLLAWLTSVLVLVFCVRTDTGMMAQVALLAAAGILGPTIVWQWSHRRIHRGTTDGMGRRSIRQIMGFTFTIALAIATLKLCETWGGLSTSFTVMVVSSACLWALMLWIVLGRWWWLIIFTAPLIVAQGVAVSFLIDGDSRNFDDQLMRCIGYHLAFYPFALLLLTLMRTGGHRW